MWWQMTATNQRSYLVHDNWVYLPHPDRGRLSCFHTNPASDVMSLFRPIWDCTPGGHTRLARDTPPPPRRLDIKVDSKQRRSNVVTAPLIMAQRWGSTESLPSAKCYLYSSSYNNRVYKCSLLSDVITSCLQDSNTHVCVATIWATPPCILKTPRPSTTPRAICFVGLFGRTNERSHCFNWTIKYV